MTTFLVVSTWCIQYCKMFCTIIGLKIVAGYRIMSGQNGDLTGQKLLTLVMLIGHLSDCLVLKVGLCLQKENYTISAQPQVSGRQIVIAS